MELAAKGEENGDGYPGIEETGSLNGGAGVLTFRFCLVVLAVALAAPGYGQRGGMPCGPNGSQAQPAEPARPQGEGRRNAAGRSLKIPLGTILPIRLNTAMSSGKSRAGQRITGTIMQNVPLPSGKKISKGSLVVGRIVSVTAARAGGDAEVSFQFDELLVKHETEHFHLTTNLRAIAGYLEVEAAQIPEGRGAGESDVYDWLTTKQIGGDDVYGRGGPVTKWNDASEVVGKAMMDGGVLAHVSARGECRGELYGNDAPQALWLFSSDACGVYGLRNVRIAHAGRSDPTGLIVLCSPDGKVNLPSGTAMLLRVNQIRD